MKNEVKNTDPSSDASKHGLPHASFDEIRVMIFNNYCYIVHFKLGKF